MRVIINIPQGKRINIFFPLTLSCILLRIAPKIAYRFIPKDVKTKINFEVEDLKKNSKSSLRAEKIQRFKPG